MIDTESFDFIQLVRISTPDPTQLRSLATSSALTAQAVNISIRGRKVSMKSQISWSRVASSNLASSSKDETHPSGWVLLILEPSKDKTVCDSRILSISSDNC